MENKTKQKKCCKDPKIEEGKIKYPLGLPLDTIRLTYCLSCGKIHEVTW